MASPTVSQASSRRSIALRVLGLVALVAVLLVAGVLGRLYLTARASLPQLDGAVQAAGVGATVRVIRDAQGIPHIRATSMEDLLFAQGYITAQDRLWQMDMTRRAALGELAEILGPSVLPHDRQQRILLMGPAAERALAALTARDRQYLETYARGVNAFLESHGDKLPIEFRVLGYSPRPWRPADSLAVGLYMCEMLNHGLYRTELNREKILAKLGPELASDLYPNSSWHDRPPGADGAKLEAPAGGDEDEDEDPDAPPLRRASARAPAANEVAGEEWDAGLGERFLPGSNNWVVSGARTVSGKPLLSNDMHLGLQVPSIWYEAQLEVASGTPPFDVAGFTLPGLPFVVVGHNQRIAWGFTNLGPDVEDVFIETFNEQGEYQTPEGWKKPEVRPEVIHVKGQAEETLGVVITRHGPLITGLVRGETRQLALQWGPIHDPAYLGFALEEVNAAQNWEEFRRAFSQFGGPPQNVVYADVDGHIGYQAMGRIPIRASGDGSLPAPGNDNAHEWVGVVPYDKLPSVLDPASGILATANNRVTPDGYPYSLSSEWFSPYRAERIYRVLASGKKFAPEDMLGLQTDVVSEFDRFCAERLVYAVDHAKNPSPRARQAADAMRSWDGRVSADAAAPTLVAFARVQLWQLLLEPKLGADHKLYHWGMQAVALENILLRQPPRWLPDSYANYEELLTAAVEAVVSRRDAPRDLGSWRWGQARRVRLQHPVFGKIPVLGHWAGPGQFEESGDGYTVKQVGSDENFNAVLAPSERMTVDFSNLDASTMNIVTGESGQIFSRHYLDQFAAWAEGRTFVFPFSDAAVEKARRHELRLEPKK